MLITMPDELKELSYNFIIPDNTKMEEHTIITQGDVIIGNRVKLSYGIIADSIIIGEHADIEGNIISHSDLRVDLWTKIKGSVQTRGNAYFGEFVNITGRLSVDGNLDVGNNVKINEGYTARGWIVVRNPLPVITYIFLYLITLLQIGRAEEVEKALEELFSEDESLPSEKLMMIPDHSHISLTEITTQENMIIHNDCRLFGNIRARALYMNERNHLFGSIRTEQDIFIGTGCIIHGKLESKANIIISRGVRVMGDVDARTLVFHETAHISGTMRAPDGVTTLYDDTNGLAEDELSIYYGFSLLFPEYTLEEQLKHLSVDSDAFDAGYTD